jgi:hypothetical protein
MTNSDAIRAAAFEALSRVIQRLGQKIDSSDPEVLRTAFQNASSGTAKDERLKRLKLTNADQYEAFSKRVRLMIERTRESDLKPGDPLVARNARLSQLRFLAIIENMCGDSSSESLLPDLSAIMDSSDDDRARREARALELIVRSLVGERYGNQAGLVRRLRELFKEDVVKDWLAKADKNDILSGTAFSELCAIFLDPAEFAGHKEKLFDPSPFLTLLKDKRKTIADFLNDIRGIRNTLAHHKKLSSLQMILLDVYYDEIVTPVQEGYDSNQTSINPHQYFDVSKEEIDQYFSAMRDDLREVKDSVEELGKDIGEVGEEVRGLGAQLRKHWVLGVGATCLLALTLAFTIRTSGTTQEISTDVKKIDHKLDNVKQETSADPRKELANMGVAWSKEKFVEAIKASDAKVVSLFIRGGVSLNDSFTKLNIAFLFAKDKYPSHEEVLKVMRSEGMDFFKTFSNESLTPLQTAVSDGNVAGVRWLIESHDRSLLKDESSGKSFADGLGKSDCPTNPDVFKAAELLVAAGINATQAYKRILYFSYDARHPKHDRLEEEQRCTPFVKLLKPATENAKAIEAEVKGLAIKSVEEWIATLQREIDAYSNYRDSDIVVLITSHGYHQTVYGQLKKDNAEKIRLGKARIQALSAI